MAKEKTSRYVVRKAKGGRYRIFVIEPGKKGNQARIAWHPFGQPQDGGGSVSKGAVTAKLKKLGLA